MLDGRDDVHGATVQIVELMKENAACRQPPSVGRAKTTISIALEEDLEESRAEAIADSLFEVDLFGAGSGR